MSDGQGELARQIEQDVIRLGPPVAYIPMLTSLAAFQRNPRVPFPVGYRRHESGNEAAGPLPQKIIVDVKYGNEPLTPAT
jgi:hypothetical protein